MKDKYYFFRDLNSGENHYNGMEFHASGVVVERYSGSSQSGKDISVMFLNPFTGRAECEWRGDSEIELYDTSEWEWKMVMSVLGRVGE